MAGWSKVFSYERRLKGWDNFFANHPEQEETPALGKLQDVLVELGPAPKDRSRSYDELMKEFDPWTKSIGWPKLDPKNWRATLPHIAKYYPEIWNLLFRHYCTTRMSSFSIVFVGMPGVAGGGCPGLKQETAQPTSKR